MRGRPAGLRTTILTSAVSALVMIISEKLLLYDTCRKLLAELARSPGVTRASWE